MEESNFSFGYVKLSDLDMPNYIYLQHYENTLIQIYWQFYHQKFFFSGKNSNIFIFLLKT